MANPTTDLRSIVGIVVRRRAIILVSTLGALISSLFIRTEAPLIYEASTSLEIHGQVEKAALMVRYSPVAENLTQVKVIQSYPVLAEAAKRIGQIPREMAWEEISSRNEWLQVLKKIRASITVKWEEQSSIITITAKATKPVEARDLANAIAQAYGEYYSRAGQQTNQEVLTFVQEQRSALNETLKEAEEKLRRFKLDNNFVSLEPRIAAIGEQQEKLISGRDGITKSIQNMQEALGWLDEKVLTAADVQSIMISLPEPAVQPALQELQKAHRDMEELLVNITPAHPAAQEAREQIGRRLQNTRKQLLTLLDQRAQQLHDAEADLENYRRENQSLLSLESDLKRLENEVDVIRDMGSFVEKQYHENRIKNAYMLSRVEIVQPAILPEAPVGKPMARFAPKAAILLLGLVVGIGLAFVRESLDFTLNSITEIEHHLKLPVLTVLPQHDVHDAVPLHSGDPGPALPASGGGGGLPLPVHREPKSTVSESLRALRTRLIREHPTARVYMICSATPQEGKTTTAANLALIFAQGGHRTLLVEANLRRPTVGKLFQFGDHVKGIFHIIHEGLPPLQAIVGPSDFFIHGLPIEDIEADPGLSRLNLLLSGGIDPRPAESIEQFLQTDFLTEARERYDYIIIDTPPILAVTDGTILAGKVDAAILVYRAGRVDRELPLRASELLQRSGTKICGVVVNGVDVTLGGARYYYYYRYTYGQSPGQRIRPRTKPKHAWSRLKDKITSAARPFRMGGPA